MLDKLGYKRGSDGIRRTPGAELAPDGLRRDHVRTAVSGIDREFAIVRDSFAKIGVKLTQRSYDFTTAFAEITKPKNQYLDFDLMMWDWIGYTDPDFVLSVVGCDQYGGWSDTAYCNKAYDKLYQQQGITIDPAKRKQIVWKMQEILYRDKPYIQLVQLDSIYGFRKGWTGIAPPYLNGLGKLPWINWPRASGARAAPHAQLRLRRQADRVRDRDDLRRDHAQLRDLPRRPRRRDDRPALPLMHGRGAGRRCARSSASTSPSSSSTCIYLRTSRRATSGARSRTASRCSRSSGSRSRTRCRCCCWARSSRSCSASSPASSPPGGAGTLLEKLSVWTGLAFFSLPTQWLAIMLILYVAGPLGLPTHGISDPYLSFSNPSLWAEFTRPPQPHGAAVARRSGSCSTASTR